MKNHRVIFLVSVFLCFLPALVAIAADKPSLAGDNKDKKAVVKQAPVAKAISIEEAGNKVLNTVNKNFVPQKNAILSGKPAEESGLYKVELSIENNTQSFYLTKDGEKLIFPNGSVDIAKFEEDSQKRQDVQKEEIPKTERPSVELFVMSLCPYGVKAEKEILPVINSFGDKVDFKMKFIVNVRGNTINEVDSLHGNEEAREDVRQAAIMKYYPDKFGSYIEKIDKNSCLISCGSVKLQDYWKKAAKELRIDVKKVESFAYGQEGMDLLRQNEADAKKYQVSGSPTLVINGITSRAIYDGPEAVKKVICSAFKDPVEICQK